MATLLELSAIEENSLADPGEPPDAAIVAARELRAKVKMAILRRAATLLVTALPTDDTRADALDRLAWAQRVVTQPDIVTDAVLRLALVRAPGAATPAAIMGATDQAIEDGITPILALLAKSTGQR